MKKTILNLKELKHFFNRKDIERIYYVKGLNDDKFEVGYE